MNSKQKSRTLPITALQNHSGGGVTSTVANEKRLAFLKKRGKNLNNSYPFLHSIPQ
jgi:hypothetical protein